MAILPTRIVEGNPWLGFQGDTSGTLNILEAARIMDIDRVVFTSSVSAYAPITGEYAYPTYKPINEDYPKYPPTGVYGTAKVAGELMGLQYNQKFGLEFVALRFSKIYGIGKKARHSRMAFMYNLMIENAMLGKPTNFPKGGDEKIDIVYVKDVANSIVLACFAQNLKHHDFNIGSGEGYTLHDVANAIKKIYPEAVFNIGPGLDYIGFGKAYSVFDISRARDELGYHPKFTMEDGVRDYVETMKRFNIELTYTP